MPVINASDLPTGNLRGAEHDASISLILDRSKAGDGPRLHKHPYDETWVVIDGTVTFQADTEELEAGPGDIVIVPPDTPHKFTNNGPERAYLVCIHANPTFIIHNGLARMSAVSEAQRTLTMPNGSSFTIIESTVDSGGERIEFEATLPPHTNCSPALTDQTARSSG